MTHSIMPNLVKTNKVIDAGIGTIQYREPDNLLLQLLMENLEEAIAKQGVKKVSEILNALR